VLTGFMPGCPAVVLRLRDVGCRIPADLLSVSLLIASNSLLPLTMEMLIKNLQGSSRSGFIQLFPAERNLSPGVNRDAAGISHAADAEIVVVGSSGDDDIHLVGVLEIFLPVGPLNQKFLIPPIVQKTWLSISNFVYNKPTS